MSELVIDDLEVIEVDQSEGQREAVTLHTCHFIFQTPFKGTAVWQAGQLVCQAEQAYAGEFICQLAAVVFDQLQVVMGTIEFVCQLILSCHQFFGFADERQAHVFNFIEIFRLSQFRKNHLKDGSEFFILGDGFHDLLTEGDL